jgi:putative transposase
VSIRRACRVLPFDTSSYHYQSRRIDPAFLKKRIKEICETHVRYGYRRVYCILRRDGWAVNMKKEGVGPITAQQDPQATGQGEAA